MVIVVLPVVMVLVISIVFVTLLVLTEAEERRGPAGNVVVPTSHVLVNDACIEVPRQEQADEIADGEFLQAEM